MTEGSAQTVEDMMTFFTMALIDEGGKKGEAKKTEEGLFESVMRGCFKVAIWSFKQLSQYLAKFCHVKRFGNVVFYKQFLLLT